ncbi:hypothetical protein MMC14_006279 [Varicellaria rhodocarpa]|nr:hypothetical protein [Varicellaria rhodocarpa]
MAQLSAYGGANLISRLHNDTYPAIEPTGLKPCRKYVFVTGASKGIGRATAISYAKAGAAAIAVAARSDLSSLRQEIMDAATSAGRELPQVVELNFDILDRQNIESAARRVESAFGRLDIIINNAATMDEFKPIVDSNPDEWWQTWTVNIRGTYLVTHAFLPLMLKGGDKQIINITSLGAFALTPGASAYQISKLALIRYTEYLNVDYGDQGVVAFALHPASVLTDISRTMPEKLHKIFTDTPELAADTMVFLTSEKREWLRGRYISCNWNMPEFIGKEEEIVREDKLKIKLNV